MCHGPLDLRAEREVEHRVETGTPECPSCLTAWPIQGFIPRFVPPDNYAVGFGYQWRVHAHTQCDSRNGTRISETRFFEETGWPRHLPGEVILEVGCGSGRFTEQALKTGAVVVSLDYSAAVESNLALNQGNPNLLVVQGDVYALPVAPGSCDRVFCLGVLQHTPDPRRAFQCIIEPLRPGGRLAMDIYRQRTGVARLTMTHRWVRPLTRRMNPRLLYRLTRRYVRAMWPLSRLVHRIPRIGKKLNWMLLVADYRDVLPLPEPLLREWAILDTFDMLNPRYEFPQTLDTVRRWFEEARLGAVQVRYGYNGIEGRGIRA